MNPYDIFGACFHNKLENGAKIKNLTSICQIATVKRIHHSRSENRLSLAACCKRVRYSQ